MSSVQLTQAVTSGDAGAVKAMLANGADVNERTGGGQTPLILATIFNHSHLIPLLLDAGADPQLRDNLGLNAIDWAQRRGATEVIALLNNNGSRTAGTSTATRPQTPPRRSEPDVEKTTGVSDEERSRRWIAGLKQRIAEQSQREVPDGPNIFRPQSAAPQFEPQEPLEPEPSLASTEREPQPEIPVDPSPQPEMPSAPPAEPEIPAPPPDPQHDLPAEPQQPEPESPAAPSEPEVAAASRVIAPEVVAPEAAPETRRRSYRKRCPKCNAIYNSDLVAYCAHHIVALVDDDEPAPILSQPQTTSPVLFWMIIAGTLIVSIVGASVVAAFLYRSDTPQPVVTATPPPTPRNVQKGTPAVSKELEGKVLSLPIAECPLNGQEAIPGTVTVRVTINRSGHVTDARPSGGDWLLRNAASEAAKKSTFAPEKLPSRTTVGTISYTFEP